MKDNIIIRPHGKAYILYLSLKYVILVGVLMGDIWVAISHIVNWWLLLLLFPSVLLLLQTRELFLYKIQISKTNIYLAANRDLFLKKHSSIILTYTSLQKIQYCLKFEEVGFIVSKIALIYDNSKVKYLDVSRYSNKQIKTIMEYIKEYAALNNGYPLERVPNQVDAGLKASNIFIDE